MVIGWDGRIAAVGTEAELTEKKLPASDKSLYASVIDATGKSIVPGIRRGAATLLRFAQQPPFFPLRIGGCAHPSGLER
jgi:hypothetical protein